MGGKHEQQHPQSMRLISIVNSHSSLASERQNWMPSNPQTSIVSDSKRCSQRSWMFICSLLHVVPTLRPPSFVSSGSGRPQGWPHVKCENKPGLLETYLPALSMAILSYLSSTVLDCFGWCFCQMCSQATGTPKEEPIVSMDCMLPPRFSLLFGCIINSARWTMQENEGKKQAPK